MKRGVPTGFAQACKMMHYYWQFIKALAVYKSDPDLLSIYLKTIDFLILKVLIFSRHTAYFEI